MILYNPYKGFFVTTQGFGQNANTYYKEGGLLGHTALDMFQKHEALIYSTCNGYCFSVLNKDNPDPMYYRCAYILVDEPENGLAYEVSYGHLNNIIVEVGEVKLGAVIGTQGNTGDVASGGIKVTREMKQANSGAGSHLHFQVRLLKKVPKIEKGKYYIKDAKGNYFKKDDMYFEIPEYKNGYNGCIDPSQFMNNKEVPSAEKVKIITQTLRYGSRGTEVVALQKFLEIKADGIFGTQTDKAVKEFQKANGLKADGIVGILTRAKING